METSPRAIAKVAEELGLTPDDYIPYGRGKAKLELAVLELLRHLWETQRGAANRPGGALGEGLAPTLPGAAYAFPIRVSELITSHVRPGF